MLSSGSQKNRAEPTQMKLGLQKITKGRQVVKLATEDLHSCRIQPEGRTAPARYVQLKKLIEEAGAILSPLLVSTVSGRMEIGDGHGRWHVARDLGWKTVPAILFEDYTAQELWRIANGGTRKIRGEDWLSSWAKSSPQDRHKWLTEMPPIFRSHIARCVEIFSERRLVEVGKMEWVNPSLRGIIDKIHLELTTKLHKAPKHAVIGEWLIADKRRTADMHALLRITNVNNLRKLYNRISTGKPFPRSDFS